VNFASILLSKSTRAATPWNCIDAVMLAVDLAVLVFWGRWWRWAGPHTRPPFSST
jgi:hypothetical protein